MKNPQVKNPPSENEQNPQVKQPPNAKPLSDGFPLGLRVVILGVYDLGAYHH